MKAKTYQSRNDFTSPQSISIFGIPIRVKGNLKYIGLEEFNSSKTLTEIKFESKNLAYIPCFSENIRPNLTQLDLFYSAGNNVTIHYATLYGIQQIANDISQINKIRKTLNEEHFMEGVANNQEFQNNYAELFGLTIEVYTQNFRSNHVIAD